MTASTGSISGLVWTGDASSVTFTITSGQRRITSIIITGTPGEGGGEDDGGDGEDTEYTQEGIMKDICLNIWETAVADEDYFEDDDGSLYTGCQYEATADDLETIIEDLEEYLPEYLSYLDESCYIDTDSGYGYSDYCTEEEEFYVEIYVVVDEDDANVVYGYVGVYTPEQFEALFEE